LLRHGIDWGLVLRQAIDLGLVLLLAYLARAVISDRRTFLMVRGFVGLMLVAAIVRQFKLGVISFVLNNLVIGAAVVMALTLQSEFRRLLEQLGRGEILPLLRPQQPSFPKADSVIDEIVDAVKELSQSRTGALLVLETGRPLDERDFSVPGVRLNAEVSKELIQTIFQTSTLLHDGAVLIRGSRLLAASAILPLSEQTTSRRLGTRHRAAMGITERVENCVCVVVSEETGSISLAHKGALNRPLTSSKLKELLEDYLTHTVEREAVTSGLRSIGRQLRVRGTAFSERLLQLVSMTSRKQK
jgi:uncharacterized protein (TIGR00159 family)